MCEQSGANQQENGDNREHQSGSRNHTEAPSSQDNVNHNYPQHEVTFSVPASQGPIEQDFDHRTMITIQSQQGQGPQEVWFDSPTQRVLYHPTMVWNFGVHQDAPQETTATNTTDSNADGNGPNSSA
jgi:hypothetical protein